MPYRTSPLRLEANDDGTRSLARALLALAALLAFATLSAVASDVASRLGRYEGAVDIERIAGHALDVAVPAALAWIAWSSRPRSACRRTAAIAALAWPASLAFEWVVPERAFAFRGHTLVGFANGWAIAITALRALSWIGVAAVPLALARRHALARWPAAMAIAASVSDASAAVSAIVRGHRISGEGATLVGPRFDTSLATIACTLLATCAMLAAARAVRRGTVEEIVRSLGLGADPRGPRLDRAFLDVLPVTSAVLAGLTFALALPWLESFSYGHLAATVALPAAHGATVIGIGALVACLVWLRRVLGPAGSHAPTTAAAVAVLLAAWSAIKGDPWGPSKLAVVTRCASLLFLSVAVAGIAVVTPSVVGDAAPLRRRFSRATAFAAVALGASGVLAILNPQPDACGETNRAPVGVPLLELIAVVAAIVASSAAGGLAHAARIAIELERDRTP